MPVTSGPNVQNTFSFGSAVDERTRNKLYGAWIKEGGISCMALSSGYISLAVCLASQWIKERGIIDMRVRAKVALYSVAERRWRTDIQCWRNDFIRWRTDSLAKRPVTLNRDGH